MNGNPPRYRYDFSMDYKDISERIALLTQEIRDLQQVNDDPRNQKINGASHGERELRLRQIRNELSRDDEAYATGAVGRTRRPIGAFPRTYSAHETLPTGPVLIVPELYTSGLSDGRVIGFDYNHINIVKPKDRDADVYRWVKSRLLDKSRG